jgi:hypothetical protein
MTVRMRVYVIGFLGPGSAQSDAYRVTEFRRGLNESGYVERQNLTIDYRWAEGHYGQLPALLVGVRRHAQATTNPRTKRYPRDRPPELIIR